MLVLGIDPASGSAGLCLVDTDADRVILNETNVAVKTSPAELPEVTLAKNISDWEMQVERICLCYNVELAVVEKVSVSWNLDTVRKIAYFEAGAMLAAARAGVPAIMVQVTSARLAVFGSGSVKKAESDLRVRNQLQPSVKWGSDDETDAYVLAKAGPDLVEKRWKKHREPKRKAKKKT